MCSGFILANVDVAKGLEWGWVGKPGVRSPGPHLKSADALVWWRSKALVLSSPFVPLQCLFFVGRREQRALGNPHYSMVISLPRSQSAWEHDISGGDARSELCGKVSLAPGLHSLLLQ